MASRTLFCLRALVFLALATTALSELSPNFYDKSCPNALWTIKSVVEAAVNKERRMGASLLRVHFYDCFVNVLYNYKVSLLCCMFFNFHNSSKL